MKILKTILILASIGLAGCATTPQVVTTELTYNRDKGTFSLRSPKDVQLESLQATRLPDGSLDLSLQGYNATANAAAVEAATSEAQARAQMMGVILQLVQPYLQAPPTAPVPVPDRPTPVSAPPAAPVIVSPEEVP